MKILKCALALAIFVGVGGMAFLFSGVYPMGADVPHNALTYWALENLRERSIARASSNIEVPDLDDPKMLLAGGADYNDMCSGCHLRPGKSQSDMPQGLYPSPPNLAQSADGHGHDHGHGDEEAQAARQFWIIKHGIKASGMAAFGLTHDDARIWAMVAFLQRLPTLSPEQYQILTARRGVEPSAEESPASTPSPTHKESEDHGKGHHH